MRRQYIKKATERYSAWKQKDKIVLKLRIYAVRDWGTRNPRYLVEMPNGRLQFFNPCQLDGAKKV